MLTGMGYTGKYGSFHLLRLNIQTNTLTAILHNMIAWQISELDKRLILNQINGYTYLTNQNGSAIQFRLICDQGEESNLMKPLPGIYAEIRYSVNETNGLISINTDNVKTVEVTEGDWLILEEPTRTI